MLDPKFWKFIQFFKQHRFDSPDKPGSGINMDKDFIILLDTCRMLAGIPFIVKSGFRTAKRNKKIKGSKNSAHLRGLAADIKARSSYVKYKIITSCMCLGIKRIGIYKNHIHIDTDRSLPDPRIWRGTY